MGISLRLVNLDNVWRSAGSKVFIVNDMPTVTEGDRDALDRLVTETFQQADYFANEPSCPCRRTQGEWRIGEKCPHCRMTVQAEYDQDLNPILWMRGPLGVDPKGPLKLINPMVLIMLSNAFTYPKKVGGFNLIEWMMNTDYQPTIEKPPELEELKAMGVVRGYKNFIDNFDEYLKCLFSLSSYQKTKKTKKSKTIAEHAVRTVNKTIGLVFPNLNKAHDERSDLEILIDQQRDAVLCSHIPLPNKAMLVIEKNKVKSYIDPMLVSAIEVIKTIPSIDDPILKLTPIQKQNRIAKIQLKQKDFYYELLHTFLAKKAGLNRKHIYGWSNNFSTRSVISSKTKAHKYNEISIGWSQGIAMMQIHLHSVLRRLGFTPNQADKYLQEHHSKYSPLIDRIFKMFIAQSPTGVLPVTDVRNPTLGRGSVQNLGIDCFKTDTRDQTTSHPIMDVSAYNADFDGKQIAVFKPF